MNHTPLPEPLATPRVISHDEVLAHFSPMQAVTTLRETLQSGFDPADDLERTKHPSTHGQFLLMPSVSSTAFGIKLLSTTPKDYSASLPLIQGTYVLFDGETLGPTAVIDGIAITNLRTPAVSISCIYHLVSRGSGPLNVVIFGTGAQGVAHARTVQSALGYRKPNISFISRSTPVKRYAWYAAGSAEAAAVTAQADVILCTTTATEPFLHRSDVADHAIIVAVGSHTPDAREIASDLMADAQVIIEDFGATLREGGDVIQALEDGSLQRENLITYRDVVTAKARLERTRPIVFKFTGMPWEDLAIAEAINQVIAH